MNLYKIFALAALLLVFFFGSSVGTGAQTALQKSAVRPKIEGTNETGFGGFITEVTPCICKTIGMLIKVSGPYGGSFIYSFSNPPKVKVGQFFLVGGPVLGGAGSGASCGTDLDGGSCINEEDGDVITYLGGIL